MELKKKLLETCFRIQNEKAKAAKEAMDDLQQQANDYGAPRDRYDAYRNQLLRKRDLFAEQYQKAMDDRNILERVDSDVSTDKVEFGAIVITTMQILFISIGLGKVNIDDKEIFVISPNVPVYKVMEGLKEGDEYMFNNKKFKIKQIL